MISSVNNINSIRKDPVGWCLGIMLWQTVDKRPFVSRVWVKLQCRGGWAVPSTAGLAGSKASGHWHGPSGYQIRHAALQDMRICCGIIGGTTRNPVRRVHRIFFLAVGGFKFPCHPTDLEFSNLKTMAVILGHMAKSQAHNWLRPLKSDPMGSIRARLYVDKAHFIWRPMNPWPTFWPKTIAQYVFNSYWIYRLR